MSACHVTVVYHEAHTVELPLICLHIKKLTSCTPKPTDYIQYLLFYGFYFLFRLSDCAKSSDFS